MRKYFLAALLRLRVNADTLYLIDLNMHNLIYQTQRHLPGYPNFILTNKYFIIN